MSQLLRTAAHNSAVGRDSEDDRGFTASDGDAGFTSEGWESDSSSVNGKGSAQPPPTVPTTWLSSFQKAYEDITSQDRKASSSSARANTLNEILFLLRVKYCMPAIEILGGSAPLGNALIRILHSARSERETSLASLCLAMLAATDAAEAHSICTASAETFQRSISCSNNKEEVDSKAIATVIIGYAAVNVFANSLFTLDNALEYFHDIIESDGDNISRMGDGIVVVAAIRAFSAVAASMLPLDDNDDLKRSSQTPTHLFQRFGASLVNQLDSTHGEVRNEAGKAIALIISNSQLDSSFLTSNSGGDNGYSGDYEGDGDGQEEGEEEEAQVPNLKELAQQLEELSRESSKRISKSARREQHSVFRDVLKTVNGEIAKLSGIEGNENNDEKEEGGGGGTFSIETIKFGKTIYRIDTWVKAIRIDFLRNVFAEGFQTQFAYNSTIRRSYLGYKGRVMLKGHNKESQNGNGDDEVISSQASATKASSLTDDGNVGKGREARKQERVEKTKNRQVLHARENRGQYHS